MKLLHVCSSMDEKLAKYPKKIGESYIRLTELYQISYEMIACLKRRQIEHLVRYEHL